MVRRGDAVGLQLLNGQGGITETELARIAAIAANILAADPEPATVAIPFLHVQSGHPNVVTRYQTLLGPGRHWCNDANVLLARVGIPILSVFADKALWSGDPLPERADVLFVSHFLNAAQADAGKDLYFGDLPDRLASTGITAVTALINHSRQPWRKLARRWHAGQAQRVVVNRTIGPVAEIGIARRLHGAAARLKRQPAAGPLEHAVHRAASSVAASSGSRTALRLSIQVRELVQRLRPKVLVTTFEGHSWERLVYAAAHEADPDLLCVGYSHAVLFPCQYAIALRLGHGYDPDVILTAGDITRDRLRGEPSLSDIPVETLGSVRRSDVVATVSESREPICLVLPEGIISECVLLARVAVQAALSAPAIRFRMRLHPLTTREQVIAAEPALRALPPNVEWSVAGLDADLQQARWTIYRGSSAVIQAVRQGVRPFYFAPPDAAFDLDPLASVPAGRERFATAAELAAALDRDRLAAPTEQSKADASVARNFCECYFMPMRPEILAALVDKGGVI